MSSSSSFDSTTLEDAKFIGSVMAKTVAYFQNRLGETSRARSKPRKPRLRRNREARYDRFIEDYFADDAIYVVKFRRRFRMRDELFIRIVSDLEGRFPYFQWKMDARRIKGFSPIQKCTAAISQLAYDMSADRWDEYFRMSERNHGFPGMLGSIDCMHCGWSLCPNTWRGQYMRGDHKDPKIVLEAIASHDLWIWHAFFGPSGANNDINVLD
ncbi:uncharacterized protein LOC111904072 [Lactuca sativa]|uniref:uncharacterized protein LOC111904072 n=1 Tax=Lactuca sativa TaxID=4236 RepID=UPI000CD8D6E7|nr:uncharacterized protein LOC111904072 [Lactuca sativa]